MIYVIENPKGQYDIYDGSLWLRTYVGRPLAQVLEFVLSLEKPIVWELK